MAESCPNCAKLTADLAQVTAISDGRKRELELKCEEAIREWARAENGEAKVTTLTATLQQMQEALEAQHQALDWCLARIVSLDDTFYPSESPAWPAIVKGNAALRPLPEPR